MIHDIHCDDMDFKICYQSLPTLVLPADQSEDFEVSGPDAERVSCDNRLSHAEVETETATIAHKINVKLRCLCTTSSPLPASPSAIQAVLSFFIRYHSLFN